MRNVLCPCTDKIAAKYREKTFFFFTPEARESFIQNPTQFVAQNGPLKVKSIWKERSQKWEKMYVYKLFVFFFQASSHTYLNAWQTGIREDHSWWVARQATWHLLYSVQGATPNAHHCKDEKEDSFCWWGGAAEESSANLEALIKEASEKNDEGKETQEVSTEISSYKPPYNTE